MFWAVLMYRQYRSMYPDHSQILDTFWFKWSSYYFKLEILSIAFSVNQSLNFLWSIRNQISRILMKDLHGFLNDGDFICSLMEFAPTSLRACRGYWFYWRKWEKCPRDKSTGPLHKVLTKRSWLCSLQHPVCNCYWWICWKMWFDFLVPQPTHQLI